MTDFFYSESVKRLVGYTIVAFSFILFFWLLAAFVGWVFDIKEWSIHIVGMFTGISSFTLLACRKQIKSFLDDIKFFIKKKEATLGNYR